MKPPELLICAGVPQSGVPVIAAAAHQLRTELTDRAVIYPGPVAADDPNSVEQLIQRLQRRLRLAARNSDGGQTVLVADASLLGPGWTTTHPGRLCPGAEAGVAALMAAGTWARTRVLLLTRRPDRLAELGYIEAVLAGETVTPADWLDERSGGALDQLDLVERLAGLPGVDHVAVRPAELGAEDSTQLVRHVLAAVGLSDVELDLDRLELPVTKIPDRRGADILRAMSPHLDTAAERRLVAGFVLDNFAAPEVDQLQLLEPDRRESLLSAHAERSEQLLRRYFPAAPPTAYTEETMTGILPALAPVGEPAGHPRLPPLARFRRLRARVGARYRSGRSGARRRPV